MDRRPLLLAHLGEEQGAAGEVQRGEPHARRDGGAGRLPPEPSRDHQMDDEEILAVEREDDPLPQAEELPHTAPRDVADRRLRGAQHEWTADADPRDRFPLNAGAQGGEVGLDVGKLWDSPLLKPRGGPREAAY